MKVLVTGGSGMLGKHLQDIARENSIYYGWTFLSSSDLDLTRKIDVNRYFSLNSPDLVIHLAAKCGGIKDNAENKYDYMIKNVEINTNVIDACVKHLVPNLIALSSTCAFPGEIKKYPMKMKHLHKGAPESTNIGYGYSKRLMQLQIDLANEQYNTNYSYIIASNMFSEYDKFDESSHFVSRLIRKIWEAKKNGDDHITLFGDGSPLRQFMYAEDLANFIYCRVTSNISENAVFVPPWNLSIDKMARMAIEALGFNLDVRYTGSLNGQYRKDMISDLWLNDNIEFTDFKEAFVKVYRIMEKKWELN